MRFARPETDTSSASRTDGMRDKNVDSVAPIKANVPSTPNRAERTRAASGVVVGAGLKRFDMVSCHREGGPGSANGGGGHHGRERGSKERARLYSLCGYAGGIAKTKGSNVAAKRRP